VKRKRGRYKVYAGAAIAVLAFGSAGKTAQHAVSSSAAHAAHLAHEARVSSQDITATVTGGAGETGFAQSLEKAMGWPQTPANTIGLVAWENAEGGIGHNNPMNTTLPLPGSSDFNSAGVQAYTSLQQGMEATADTLNNGLYGSVKAVFARGGASLGDVESTIKASSWGTCFC
jgi:hypothetical protein